MTAREAFRELFRNEEAERELARLGGHIIIPTFNLATSSLRHLDKWYERLEDIKGKRIGRHGNYYTDPVSVGLVAGEGRSARLTKAGEQFLASRNVPPNAMRGEYDLVKSLFYSGLNHSRSAAEFLDKKRQNLLRFLSDCPLGPNSNLLLERPKLLAIAEILAGFPGAVHRFLELSREDLIKLEDLGVEGFKNLWPDALNPPGLRRLARKIGEDYTRAADRRRDVVIAMVLNEIRWSMLRRGILVDELVVPTPFANLVTPELLLMRCADYTDDIRVDIVDGKVLVFLNPRQVAHIPAPRVMTAGIRVPGQHRGRVRRTVMRRARKLVGIRVLDVALAKEAEDYVEKTLLLPRFGDRLVRVGHTNRETQILADGGLPGADFYVSGGEPDMQVAFQEVKSSVGAPPNTISITRAEYRRALWCKAQGLPYEVFVVVFERGTALVTVLRIPDFAERVASLSLSDVMSFDIALDRP